MAAQMLSGADSQTRAMAARTMLDNSMLDYRVRSRAAVRSRYLGGSAHVPGAAGWSSVQRANWILGPIAARLRERLRIKRLERSYRGLLHRKLTGRFPRY